MKIAGIWKVLSLCAISVLFLANRPFGESQKAITSSSTVSNTVDQVKAQKTMDTVVIKNMTFNPRELHVHKGDTVIWINKDVVAHNVTVFPDNKWTSGNLIRKSSWKKGIGESFDYYCSIHPTMKGKIVVDP